jgi:hypothetical protein
LISPSAFRELGKFAVKAINQLQVFGTLSVAPAAKPDNHVHIVWRYVLASDIAVIIVFSIEWTDVLFPH